MAERVQTAAFPVRIGEGDELRSVYLESMSAESMFVRARWERAIDQEVRVELDPPDGGSVLELRGRVVRVEPGSDETVAGLEVEFVDVSGEASARLEALLASCEILSDEAGAEIANVTAEAALRRRIDNAAHQVEWTERYLAQMERDLEFSRQAELASRTLVEQLEAERANASASDTQPERLRLLKKQRRRLDAELERRLGSDQIHQQIDRELARVEQLSAELEKIRGELEKNKVEAARRLDDAREELETDRAARVEAESRRLELQRKLAEARRNAKPPPLPAREKPQVEAEEPPAPAEAVPELEETPPPLPHDTVEVPEYSPPTPDEPEDEPGNLDLAAFGAQLRHRRLGSNRVVESAEHLPEDAEALEAPEPAEAPDAPLADAALPEHSPEGGEAPALAEEEAAPATMPHIEGEDDGSTVGTIELHKAFADVGTGQHVEDSQATPALLPHPSLMPSVSLTSKWARVLVAVLVGGTVVVAALVLLLFGRGDGELDGAADGKAAVFGGWSEPDPNASTKAPGDETEQHAGESVEPDESAGPGKPGEAPAPESNEPPLEMVAASPEELLASAHALYEARRFRPAVKAYRLAAATNSKSYELHAEWGHSLLELGKAKLAVNHLERATRIDPTRPEAYLYLGSAYWEEDRKTEARTAFEKFLELAPKSPRADEIKNLLKSL